MSTVLVVDDEEILAKTICRFLEKRGIHAAYATNSSEAITLTNSDLKPSIAFVDYRIGRESGLDLLLKLRELRPQIRIIMMTGHGDVAVAVKAMKSGAIDFLTKPVPLENIAEIALASSRSKLSVTDEEAPVGIAAIVGRSAATVNLRTTIKRVLAATGELKTDLPAVLITGESGTGKDLVAKALHLDGPRAAGPFVAVNCASLPDELVEAELFGYERGAFTDAKSQRQGLFESASGGVLFLDEIGDMPVQAQAKLLRVLEDGKIRRLGSQATVSVDVWVVAATNRPLADLVAQGKFRDDLMFRLQVLWVEVPPLRERDSDVLAISEHFIAMFAKRYSVPPASLTEAARAKLVGHSWPGNVRELRNVMERATVLSVGKFIQPEHIVLPETHEPVTETSLEGVEVAMLRESLKKCNGNVTRAAELLGISRDTMRYRIEKFGLKNRDSSA